MGRGQFAVLKGLGVVFFRGDIPVHIMTEGRIIKLFMNLAKYCSEM